MSTEPNSPPCELPALNPWARVVRLKNDQIRLVTASRTMIDLSRSDSVDVSVACRLLSRHWPRKKIMRDREARRGLQLLDQFGQLIDTRLLRFTDDRREQIKLGRALTLAAQNTSTDTTTQHISAPEPLVPRVGLLTPRWWVTYLDGALNMLGVDEVVHLGSAHTQGRRERAIASDVSLIIVVGELDWHLTAQFMKRSLPHMLITPSATSVEVWPVVTPGRSACLRCAHLARSDSDVHWATVAEALRQRPQPPIDPVLASIAAQMAGAATQDWVTGDQSIAPVLRKVNAPYGETTASLIAPHPQCPSCGTVGPESAPERTSLACAA